MTSSTPPRSAKLTCVGGDLSIELSGFRLLGADSPPTTRRLLAVTRVEDTSGVVFSEPFCGDDTGLG